MAYEPAYLAAMIAERAAHSDPTLAAVEAVMLRSGFELLDDFLVWLDQHTATEHPSDAATIGRVIEDMHRRIAAELARVDRALTELDQS